MWTLKYDCVLLSYISGELAQEEGGGRSALEHRGIMTLRLLLLCRSNRSVSIAKDGTPGARDDTIPQTRDDFKADFIASSGARQHQGEKHEDKLGVVTARQPHPCEAFVIKKGFRVGVDNIALFLTITHGPKISSLWVRWSHRSSITLEHKALPIRCAMSWYR
jgi:hypothetical protein